MGTAIKEEDYITIDLPIRMTESELFNITYALTRAARRRPPLNRQNAAKDFAAAIGQARQQIQLRKERERAFGPGMFGDPSWDLLLDLFVAETSTKPVSVSSACIGSGAPGTTALRHLANLEKRGIVVREHSQTDQRVIHVRLSEEAVETMIELLAMPESEQPLTADHTRLRIHSGSGLGSIS